MNTVDQTVQATSGKPAASVSDTPSGTGSSCPAGTTTFSAYPPPLSNAHTCKATVKCSKPIKTAAAEEEAKSGFATGAKQAGPLIQHTLSPTDHREGTLGPSARMVPEHSSPG